MPEQWQKFESHVELIFDESLQEKFEEVRDRETRETWTDYLDSSGSELATVTKKLQTYYNRYQARVQPRLNSIFS